MMRFLIVGNRAVIARGAAEPGPPRCAATPPVDATISDGGRALWHRSAVHMDCFCWVNRDSYLPQGSRGLKVRQPPAASPLRRAPPRAGPLCPVSAGRNL